jgi:hypothetical protein
MTLPYLDGATYTQTQVISFFLHVDVTTMMVMVLGGISQSAS